MARLATVWLLSAMIGGSAFGEVAAAQAAIQESPAFSIVFLKDGTTLVTVGEPTRVGQHAVFCVPTAVSTDAPLRLVQLSSALVDWERTTASADAVRAARFVRMQAEESFVRLSSELAETLYAVDHTGDVGDRLAIVEHARQVLVGWLATHDYRKDDVLQMLSTLDEAVAAFRAATGERRFDLSFATARADTTLPMPTLVAAPTDQTLIEQMIRVSQLTSSPDDRVSLLVAAGAAVDLHASELPEGWVRRTRASTAALMREERAVDRAYAVLASRIAVLARGQARAANVRGVETLLSQVTLEDEALGRRRPDSVAALLDVVHAELAAARRLRLARDHWVLHVPAVRRYRLRLSPSMDDLRQLGQALDDIKQLAGSSPHTIHSILVTLSRIRRSLAAITPPDECREIHDLLIAATRMAEQAALLRQQATHGNDLGTAWNASSAAAGALMLSAKVSSLLTAVLRPPQLPMNVPLPR